jgi:hypothetical protein
VPFAGAGAAAAGLAAAADVFGLNKSPRLNLVGDGEGVGCAAAVLAAFLVPCFALGETAGDAAGDTVACAFAAARCFAGVGDSAGDSPGVGD